MNYVWNPYHFFAIFWMSNRFSPSWKASKIFHEYLANFALNAPQFWHIILNEYPVNFVSNASHFLYKEPVKFCISTWWDATIFSMRTWWFLYKMPAPLLCLKTPRPRPRLPRTRPIQKYISREANVSKIFIKNTKLEMIFFSRNTVTKSSKPVCKSVADILISIVIHKCVDDVIPLEYTLNPGKQSRS